VTHDFDVLIVGSGLAGLCAALHLAPTHRVAVITKAALADGASARAQGGIAAVLGEGDSLQSHVDDTHVAGAGLCDAAATRFVVTHAPQAVQWLREMGVPFSLDGGELHLTREGGHSHRRIAHAADATGAAVQHALIERVRETDGIAVFEQHTLVDLASGPQPGLDAPACHGLYALCGKSGTVHAFRAPHTVLATGGAGQVYLHTTSPATATGDGIAAAWRAGCRVSNMEFTQFHPTSLHHPRADSFLISEAVRGEGGVLKLPDGTRFMPAHDARAELAPRDVVARAIDFEMKKHGLDCVELDISHQPSEFLRQHFPTIRARCASLGIDIARTPIPVVPAAHYTCGGVLTDLAGRTDLPGLYAVGETACTGLHGANRLASNSLVECIVLARAAAAAIAQAPAREAAALPAWADKGAGAAGETAAISHCRDRLRRFMWEDVGIVRSNQRLEQARRRVGLLRAEIENFCASLRMSRELLELRNLAQVAELIVQCALARRESRGLHFNEDFPGPAPSAEATVLAPA